MPGHDIIVVGASTGGVEALAQLVRDLPGDLPAALFVVLHVPARGPSALPAILRRHGPLPAGHPLDGEAIRPGRIYVAPPDRHLLLRPGSVHLSSGPHENGHRPAVDPLFRSAARAYGRRVIGVVLSGSLDDGASGLVAVAERGGVAVAQDPGEALFPSMPRSAIEYAEVQHILPVAGIAPLLVRLAGELVEEEEGEPSVHNELDIEDDIADLDLNALQGPGRPGTPAGYGCPQCGGALWELRQGGPLRFRCRVGHAWTASSLLERELATQEDALWIAFRALKEAATLTRRMAEQEAARGRTAPRSRYEEESRDFERRAEAVRQLISEGRSPSSDGPCATEAEPPEPGPGESQGAT